MRASAVVPPAVDAGTLIRCLEVRMLVTHLARQPGAALQLAFILSV
jgi:hypothetical protein